MKDHQQVHFDHVFQSSWKDMAFVTDNVAQFIVLQWKQQPTTRAFIVANCHLYWRPTHHYIKLLQVWYLLQQVTAYQRQYSIREGDLHLPIISCGGKMSLLCVLCKFRLST
jgi:mRNA deadenylase 3'-5' endonuclease subunit Ccr4